MSTNTGWHHSVSVVLTGWRLRGSHTRKLAPVRVRHDVHRVRALRSCFASIALDTQKASPLAGLLADLNARRSLVACLTSLAELIIAQLREAERNVEPGEIQELEALVWKRLPKQ